jgi:hypothetical protein
MTSATHYDISDAGTNSINNRYNEILTYADYRGNISKLSRRGGKINTSTNCWEFNQIDSLTYSYTSGTNRISTISDVAPSVWKDKGFRDGSTGSYAYDANGNTTTDPARPRSFN